MPRPDMIYDEPEEPVFIILWEDDAGQQGFSLYDLEIVNPELNKTLMEIIIDECNSVEDKSKKYHKDYFEALGIIKMQNNDYVAVDKTIYEPFVRANFKQKNFDKRLEIDAWKTANIQGHVSISGALSRDLDSKTPLDRIVGRDDRNKKLQALKDKGIVP